jgi:hypothetical protein
VVDSKPPANEPAEKAEDAKPSAEAPVRIPGVPTVRQMIEYGYKATFNLKYPKYGVKGYNIQTTYSMDPVYKPAKIAINKKDG